MRQIKNKKGSALLVLAIILVLAALGFNLFNIYENHFKPGEKADAIELLDYVEQNGFKGVPVIVIDDHTAIYPEWAAYEGDAAALYSNRTDTIYFKRDYAKSSTYVMFKLWHEYGHHIWYKTLTKAERERYIQIYSNCTGFVSQYALEQNHKEDFAETYACYKTGLKKLPVDKWNFIIGIKQTHPKEF